MILLNPDIALNNVVFPIPLVPNIETYLPLSMLKTKSFNIMFLLSKETLTFSSSILP